MSIGIDFILRANSAGFTQGVARANNSIKDFKKSLREGDVGHGLKQMFGAGAIIAGFRTVINHAQETRDALQEMGKSVPETTRQIADMADAIDDLKQGALAGGTAVVGFFTGIGSTMGDYINNQLMLMGVDRIDPMMGKELERLADKSQANADKKRRQIAARNTPEELAKAHAQLEAERDKNLTATLGKMEKRNKLEQEFLAINAKLHDFVMAEAAGTQDKDPAKEEAMRVEREKKMGEMMAAQKATANMHDKYLMTTEQLSNATVTEGMDPAKRKAIMDARQAMQLEAQANQLGFAGDMSGSDLAMAKANKLRQGLSGFVKSDEVNKDKDFAAPIVDQLKELNGKVTKGVLVY